MQGFCRVWQVRLSRNGVELRRLCVARMRFSVAFVEHAAASDDVLRQTRPRLRGPVIAGHFAR